MACTEQIIFNEKVSRPYPYSKKHDFEYLHKHVCDEHLELKVGDKEEQMWQLDVGIEVTVEPLIIHLGESDDDSN
jgi:hypothetical protein